MNRTDAKQLPQSRARELMLRLRGRPDSEHEMSFNRVTLAILVLLGVVWTNPDPAAVPVLVLYWTAGVVVFLHILFDSAVRVWRRLAVMVMDITVISYVMHSNGAYAAGIWPLYLWTVFGNGFRFGNPYLFATAAVAIVGFAVVVATTPFWQDAMGLSGGLLIGLVILPAYTSQLIRKLSKAKREAEEASRAKSYFLASVSHELRTPLTAIIGLGAHLQDSDIGADERGMAKTIVTAGRSLLSLINQLLDFSRLGAKGIHAAAEPLDLPSLLVSVRELMKVSAQEKGLRIALHVNPRTPLSIVSDEDQLRDVLVNLVGNAVKFTESGSITISADAERTSDGAIKLRFAVTDTGIGIDPEAQDHIFDSFRQADDTIIDRFGGTGLGLAICKQVAELLGGEIGVESKLGQGSSFWFTARVQEAPANAQIIEATDSGQLIFFSTDANAIEALESTLQQSGISIRAANDFEEVRTLTQQAGPGQSSAVLIDQRELDKRAIPVASLRTALGHEIAPILLRPLLESDESDPSLERSFVSIVTPHSTLEELSHALRIGSALGPQAAAPQKQPLAPAVRPCRILVADDNLVNQKVFGMILARAGHSVETADNGEAALDVMKDHDLDVVLMDVNMPVLNGIEATKLYRFMALGRRRIPIVAITADASPQTTERCLEAGMDACVSKPVEATALLQLIESLVEDRGTIRVLTPDSSGVVTPLFPEKLQETPPIDWSKLDELEELGGRDFIVELYKQYVADTKNILIALKESVASGDLDGFRNGTHALRSSGANIGASKVAEMCLHFQRIERSEFEAKGANHLDALERELERVRQTLADHDWDSPLAFTGPGRQIAGATPLSRERP